MSDPYTIRLELLKLAQSIESDRIWGDRQKLELEWQARFEEFKSKDMVLPPYPKLPYVTYKDIVKVAEELNKFVSNKG